MIFLMLCCLLAAYASIAAWCGLRLYRTFKVCTMHQLVSEARFIDELPSVSVCIAARNETNAMTQCLESVISNRYPKMEIIVLDDESGDNTSYLIKSFAHAGVRFVEGAPLPDGWLGKNHAYQTLLKEASGSYVLFVDVDTHIAPDTIGQLVSYAYQNKLTMLSVVPQRLDGWRGSVVFATLRYFWELILHSPSRPAAASAVWMIHRNTLLRDMNGFTPYSEDVIPEVSLAREFADTSTYRLLISTRLLGVRFEKKWRSQCETARRILLPRLKMELGGMYGVVAMYCVLLASLIAPLLILWTGWSGIYVGFFAVTIICMTMYAAYARRMWRRAWWMGFFVWPIILVQDAVLFVLSWLGYARGTITWKGRPVRRLPAITSSK